MSGTVDVCILDRATGLPIGVTSGGIATGGNVASGTTDSGNPVKVGAVYKAAPPALTDGQRTDLLTNSTGNLLTAIAGVANTPFDGNTFATYAAANGQPGAINQFAVFNHVWTGTAIAMQRGDSNGAVVQSGLSATFWVYAGATGGITNTTTAVTIKTAAGASIRNYLKTLTIDHDALGAATEIAIRDGAAGTVLWRGKLQTALNEGREINFDPPLKGTANTLMEVVTLTATVTGGVFVNATGFTGS